MDRQRRPAPQWLRNWRQLMLDVIILAEGYVMQAKAAARQKAYPASSAMRAAARSWAQEIGWAVPPASVPAGAPPPPTHRPYHEKDRQRQMCEHTNADGEPTLKTYTAAKQQWMLCNLCGRRWRQQGKEWVVDDKDTPGRVPASRLVAAALRPSSVQSQPPSRARRTTHEPMMPASSSSAASTRVRRQQVAYERSGQNPKALDLAVPSESEWSAVHFDSDPGMEDV